MSAIKDLPSSKTWSLQFIKGRPTLYSGAVVAHIIYRDRVESLLDNSIVSLSPLDYLKSTLGAISIRENGAKPIIFHAFYELGSYLKNPSSEANSSSDVLGVYLEFEEKVELEESFFKEILSTDSIQAKDNFQINWEEPKLEEYKIAFSRGLEHLKRGDCYQYNLTFPFMGDTNGLSREELISSLFNDENKRGEYASYTQINDIAYYSNSPECLFERVSVNPTVLETRPIKGTFELENDEDYERVWEELSHCSKNESELYMITDLLRNDLNGIASPRASVVDKKVPLRVPGLLHSYSRIQVELPVETNLFDVLLSLFPGGSITGAPKKRVMEIIEDIEGERRGFYCGSTILWDEETLKASINIRSGVFSESAQKITYHAGSGITFDSDLDSEYREMCAKHNSLKNTLQN